MDIFEQAAPYIQPLEVWSLKGRVMRMPAHNPRQKRKILFIYGTHASHERYFGFVGALADFGEVVVPDLPGFGGMQPLRKVGKRPTIPELANYLADFLKQEYGQQRITIAGFSVGLAIVTQMLATYPELAKQVDDVISIVGFSSYQDFRISRRRQKFYAQMCRVNSRPSLAAFYSRLFLRSFWIDLVYHRAYFARSKFMDMSPEERQAMLRMEARLWQINDFSTWAWNVYEMMTFDQQDLHVPHNLIHVRMEDDQYFNNQHVEKSLRTIYSDLEVFVVNLKNHSPTVIASADEVRQLFPEALRRRLNRPV